jgi:hypothetical protein
MRSFLWVVVLIFAVGIPKVGHSGWGWLVYHERSFKGKVIDAETKEPIEGAVVVAQYYINMLGPTGSHSTLTDVQEGLTDKKGDFNLSSLTKFINPISVGDNTFFLIWKPGYKQKEIKEAYFFTKNPGTIENLPVQTEKGFEMKPVRLGIVEIVKVKAKDERRMILVGPIGEKSKWRKQKQLIKMIRKEWEYITGESAKDLYKIEEID